MATCVHEHSWAPRGDDRGEIHAPLSDDEDMLRQHEEETGTNEKQNPKETEKEAIWLKTFHSS